MLHNYRIIRLHLLLIVSIILYGCSSGSGNSNTSNNPNSLNRYAQTLQHTQNNSNRLTSANSPQQSFYISSTTNITSIDVTFYSDLECNSVLNSVSLLPESGQSSVAFPVNANGYTSSDASSYAICSLYPGGCAAEVNAGSIKFTYNYNSPIIGSTESCFSNPSNRQPYGTAGERIAQYTTPDGACTNGSSCGFSQAYNVFVNPPSITVDMQFTSLIINGESAAATIIESGATEPITVNLSANNSNVSLNTNSCTINAPIESSCIIQVSGISMNGESTILTASMNVFSLATSSVIVESPIVFATVNSYKGNLNQYCVGSSCSSDSESGVHGGDAVCNTEAESYGLSGTYKALLTASGRYACNESGNCGSGSADWPLLPSTTYLMSNRSSNFGTTTSTAIFSLAASYSRPQNTNGSTPNSSQIYIWSGISSVKYQSNNITGWGYNSNNPSVSGNTLQIANCNNWTKALGGGGYFGTYQNSYSPLSVSGSLQAGWYSSYNNSSSSAYFSTNQPFLTINGNSGGGGKFGGASINIATGDCNTTGAVIMCVQQ